MLSGGLTFAPLQVYFSGMGSSDLNAELVSLKFGSMRTPACFKRFLPYARPSMAVIAMASSATSAIRLVRLFWQF